MKKIAVLFAALALTASAQAPTPPVKRMPLCYPHQPISCRAAVAARRAAQK
jgi:hypothetical protein